jgi:hypothetical protein
VANPTNPDPTDDPSNGADGIASSLANGGPGVTSSLMPLSDGISLNGNSYGEGMYEVFDPLNWMLDGLFDIPHPSMGGPVGNGGGLGSGLEAGGMNL